MTEDIHLVIQQPVLPKYRVPVFANLSRRAGIAMTLYYGDAANAPPNIEGCDFDARFVKMQQTSLLGRTIMWHSPQWRCASRREADVLMLSWNVHYLSLIPALIRARANGVPTLLWGHGYSKQEARWRAWPRRKIGDIATALLFYNHTAAQQYIEAGCDPNRIFVALNALDQQPIQAAQQYWRQHADELAAFRREHDLHESRTILYISRLDRANRVDLLLDAAAKLKSDHPKIKIVLIGKGEAKDELMAQAERLGVAQHLIMPGAIYDEAQLARWCICADVFCYPANIGLSLLHAFGYGLPVVTSDDVAAHNPEIEALRDGENGRLYRNGDTNSLIAVLDELFQDSVRRRAMGEAARQTATEQFSLNNMVDGMEAAVRYCAGQMK